MYELLIGIGLIAAFIIARKSARESAPAKDQVIRSAQVKLNSLPSDFDVEIEVPSSSRERTYIINPHRMKCTCPDFLELRKSFAEDDWRRPCKHLVRHADLLRNQPLEVQRLLVRREKAISAVPLKTSSGSSFVLARRDLDVDVMIIYTGNEYDVGIYFFFPKSGKWWESPEGDTVMPADAERIAAAAIAA